MESRTKDRTATGGGFKPTECSKHRKNEQKADFNCDCASKLVLELSSVLTHTTKKYDCIRAVSEESKVGTVVFHQFIQKSHQFNYVSTLTHWQIFECVHSHNQMGDTTKETYSHLHFRARCDSHRDCLFFQDELRTCWTILILIYICQDASAFFLHSLCSSFHSFFAASRDSKKKTIRWKVNPSTMLGVGVLSLTNRERLEKAHTQELCFLAPETI